MQAASQNVIGYLQTQLNWQELFNIIKQFYWQKEHIAESIKALALQNFQPLKVSEGFHAPRKNDFINILFGRCERKYYLIEASVDGRSILKGILKK